MYSDNPQQGMWKQPGKPAHTNLFVERSRPSLRTQLRLGKEGAGTIGRGMKSPLYTTSHNYGNTKFPKKRTKIIPGSSEWGVGGGRDVLNTDLLSINVAFLQINSTYIMS